MCERYNGRLASLRIRSVRINKPDFVVGAVSLPPTPLTAFRSRKDSMTKRFCNHARGPPSCCDARSFGKKTMH